MPGRPPKKPGDRKIYTFRVRMTHAERHLIERGAKADGAKPSTWAREVLLEAARKRFG